MIFTLLQFIILSFAWGILAAWIVYRACYKHEPDPGKIAFKQFILGFLMPPISLIVVLVMLRRYRKAEKAMT
jgi:hypothetical protein